MKGAGKQHRMDCSLICLPGAPPPLTLFVPFWLSPLPRFILFIPFLFVLGSVPTVSAQSPNLIQTIRTLATDDATRVVITLSHPTPYEITTEPLVSASQQDARPTRLHLTFSPAKLGTAVPSTLNIGDALLASVHSGQISSSAVRISLELAGGGAYRVSELRSPDQVVISLRKTSDRPRLEPEGSRHRSQPSP